MIRDAFLNGGLLWMSFEQFDRKYQVLKKSKNTPHSQ